MGDEPPVLGRLIVVSTPIGNLGDLSPRAAAALESADLLACEDTRVTRKLYSHLGLRFPRTCTLNEHTEATNLVRLVEEIQGGKTVVLCSDAGSPAVSDPGYLLVGAVAEAGCQIDVVPGPSAVIAAIMSSGLSCSRFCFEGFLPRKGSSREQRLRSLSTELRSIIVFESPKRVHRTLDEFAALWPGREIAICQELTKLHERVIRGKLGEVDPELVSARGEFVLVIGPSDDRFNADDEQLRGLLREHRDAGDSLSFATREIAHETGASRRHLYQLALDSGLW